MQKLSTTLLCALLAIGSSYTQEVYSGIKAFGDIREGYLLIRLPGFSKKISTIDSLLSQPGLSERSADMLEEEMERTIKVRDLIQKWYPSAFDSMYTFSKVAFINDGDTEQFEKGSLQARSVTGQPLADLHNQPYIIATLHGQYGDPFKFRTPGHMHISAPMPEQLELPEYLAWFSSFGSWPQWVKDDDDSQVIRTIYLHVQRLNRKFEKTFEKWVANAGG